ncbi:MAG: VWA domain-containing protein [Terriglobales bacterium]
MRRLLATLAAASLLVPFGPAQDKTPSGPKPAGSAQAASASEDQAVFRVTVNMVLIDARVTDRSGKPIKGLTPEQFTLLEDGKPQKISSLDYHDLDAMEAAGLANQPTLVVPLGVVQPPPEVQKKIRDRRLIVLFFDQTALQPDELMRSKEGCERFLRDQMSPADLVALAVYGNQLKITVPFTNDRERLMKGVQSLLPGKDSQLAAMQEASVLSGEDSTSEDTGAAFTPDEMEFNIFNTDRKLAALESLAEVLRVIPGRKNVIHFTGGITQTGEENRSQLRISTNAANRADVSFYTVDSRGLFPTVPGGEARMGASAGSAQFSGEGKATAAHESSRAMFNGTAVYHQVQARHASRETLATLAIDTGGRPFFDLGDFKDVFRTVHSDNTGYYLIGYYSSNRQKDGRYRRISVHVNVPGARIRYREGYYAPNGNAGPDRERQLLEALREDTPRVDFPIALETGNFRLNGKDIFVPITAKLASTALQWANKHNRHTATFDFAAEIRQQDSNRVVAALRDTIHLTLDDKRQQELQQQSLVYSGGVVLGPGQYRLKFVARESESGRVGSFEENLDLQPLQRDRLELSSMVLSGQLEAAAPNREQTKTTLGAAAHLKTTPLEVSGQRIVPSVTRVFNKGQDLYIFFQAYVPAGQDAAQARAGLEFFRDGQWWSETPLVEAAEVDETTHSASFRIRLPLEKFAPGVYTVEAVSVEQGTEEAAFAQNHFVLRLPLGGAAAAPAAQP